MKGACCTNYGQLVDVTKQPTCMKGACCSCPNINQISCNTETGQHSAMQASCCPVSVLQLLYGLGAHVTHVNVTREGGICVDDTCVWLMSPLSSGIHREYLWGIHSAILQA